MAPNFDQHGRIVLILLIFALVFLFGLSGCGSDGAGEGSSPPLPFENEQVQPRNCLTGPTEALEKLLNPVWPPFCQTPYGSGAFGQWIVDAKGDPAYDYRMDQTVDPRAGYYVSSGESRDHWHMIGNDRIVATAHNGGYVQLYDWTRGGKLINRWDPDTGNFAGGFSFITTEKGDFNTLWEHLPQGAEQQ